MLIRVIGVTGKMLLLFTRCLVLFARIFHPLSLPVNDFPGVSRGAEGRWMCLLVKYRGDK